MKAGMWAAGMILAVAACGQARPSDRQVLVDACVADGETEATCGCITDALQKNLPAELFSKTAEAVGRNNQDMMTFVGDLTGEEQLAFSRTLGDMFACSLAGEDR